QPSTEVHGAPLVERGRQVAEERHPAPRASGGGPTGPRSTRPSRTDGEARLRRLITDLERSYPSPAACMAEELPAPPLHPENPPRPRRRLRSPNLPRRSLGGGNLLTNGV